MRGASISRSLSGPTACPSSRGAHGSPCGSAEQVVDVTLPLPPFRRSTSLDSTDVHHPSQTSGVTTDSGASSLKGLATIS